MNNHSLIAIDQNQLATIETLEAVNEHINTTLGRYNINLQINWKQGLGFSKMFNEACDKASFTSVKKERSTLFKKVQAVFVREGLNDLIEATMRKFGYQARFGGSTKTGDVTMKFVPSSKTQGEKLDPVSKVVNSLADEAAQAARIQNAEAKALEAGARAAKLAQVLKDKYGVVDIEAEVTSVE